MWYRYLSRIKYIYSIMFFSSVQLADDKCKAVFGIAFQAVTVPWSRGMAIKTTQLVFDCLTDRTYSTSRSSSEKCQFEKSNMLSKNAVVVLAFFALVILERYFVASASHGAKKLLQQQQQHSSSSSSSSTRWRYP